MERNWLSQTYKGFNQEGNSSGTSEKEILVLRPFKLSYFITHLEPKLTCTQASTAFSVFSLLTSPSEHRRWQPRLSFISQLSCFFNPSLFPPPPVQHPTVFGSLYHLSMLRHRTRTPAQPEQVPAATRRVFPTFIQPTHQSQTPFSAAQKYKGNVF